MGRKGILIAAASLLLFLGFVTVYALELKHLAHTLGAGRLVGASALLGTLAGATLAYRLRDGGADPLDQFKRYVALIVVGAISFPLLASLSNRWLGGEIRGRAVTFVEMEGRYRSRFGLPEGEEVEANQHFLTFFYQDRLYRVPADPSAFETARRGQSIVLRMRPGLWGYDYVLPLD